MAVQSDPVLDPFVRYPLVAGDEFGDGMLERAKASDVEAVLGEGETGLGGGQYQFQKTGKRPGIADRWHPSFRFFGLRVVRVVQAVQWICHR
ncbi:hypothetical protein VNPA120889_27590 [Pseudomonas aeruginosa]|nr:hypothetical protein VNPA120840_26530 [Pseudomonas aeruginosa]GLF02609.1 hypothetical protein VNPA120889_27590 [Pseudomonas aeruginosa]